MSPRALAVHLRSHRDGFFSGQPSGLEMLFGAQGKLYHSFQELVGRQADKVAQNELLGIEAHQITQLERLVARGINEIPVAVVDDDDRQLQPMLHRR